VLSLALNSLVHPGPPGLKCKFIIIAILAPGYAGTAVGQLWGDLGSGGGTRDGDRSAHGWLDGVQSCSMPPASILLETCLLKTIKARVRTAPSQAMCFRLHTATMPLLTPVPGWCPLLPALLKGAVP